MNSVYKEIKEEVKKLGKDIKELKNERNTLFRESHLVIINDKVSQEKVNKASTIQWRYLPKLKYEFRHHHIARCELMGRSRDQIEKPADNNKANEDYILKIKEKWMERINENVCSDPKRFVA